MNTEAKILGIIGLITAIILVGGIFFLTKSGSSSSSDVLSAETVNIDYSKGEKIGSDSAKVKLVEFADFQCPACASAEPTIKEIINARYDNFQYIFRYFPLAQHKNAQAAANFAKFASANNEPGSSSNKFWEVSYKLFETQSQWENLGDPSDFFANIAGELGLDKTAAKEAVTKQMYKDQIQADVNEGSTIGVDSTPTFYLNGHKLNLTKGYQEVKALVEQELKK